MITLSLNFAKIFGPSERTTHEKKVRELVDTHLGFPGSDKLKLGVTIKENGASSVTFAGPSEVVSEAKRLWQENVKPVADRAKAYGVKTVASLKKKVPKVVVVVPKKKKASVKAKAKKKPVKKAPAKKKK